MFTILFDRLIQQVIFFIKAESLKNTNQNNDETMSRTIEDEQLKIENENKVIEYVMHFTN